MYQDKILIPAEAVKMAALGALAENDMNYADLAQDIRHVVARVVGPNLDLLGSSLEILRLEGLIAAVDEVQADNVNSETVLKITDSGQDVFLNLMSSALRTPIDEAGRLVYFLKIRFLDLLTGDDLLDQIDLLKEFHMGELARLKDIQKSHGKGLLAESLELEIDQQETRLKWLIQLEAESV